MRIATIASLIIGTLAIIFAVINPMAVDIKFGLFTIENASLPLVLITTLVIGVLVGYLVGLPSKLHAKRRIRTLERAATKFKEAIDTQPTADFETSEELSSPDDPTEAPLP